MGFVIGGREIKVTADGLIHLLEFVEGALGVGRESAEDEIKGMVGRGEFPEVRCFRRGEDTLVTSGGAEAVLARLVKMGRALKGPVVMSMRCFMSQNGPFAARIREGTAAIPVAEVCGASGHVHASPPDAEWSGTLLSDTDWAEVLLAEREPPRADAAEEQAPPLNRHRTRLTDLELDQIEGATEMRALEGRREHYGKVFEWYRELCADTAIDDDARAVFKRVLLDMLPACGRCWTDRHAREAWRKDIHF